MYYTKSAYNTVQNILQERLVNAVRVAVTDQCCNTELDYYRFLYGIIYKCLENNYDHSLSKKKGAGKPTPSFMKTKQIIQQ